jgi:hypothetical protein
MILPLEKVYWQAFLSSDEILPRQKKRMQSSHCKKGLGNRAGRQ